MIRINLLPYREAQRKARREHFFLMTAVVLVLAGLVGFVGYTGIDQQIQAQDSNNTFLRSEISKLDKQIEEIKELKKQTQALLARKQVIENLQKDRGEPVHLLSELVKQVPEGIYLKSLKQQGQQVTISGYAQSNARVSALMRNVEASDWMEAPRLIESKAASVKNRRVHEFSLAFKLSRQQVNNDADNPKAKSKAANSGKKGS